MSGWHLTITAILSIMLLAGCAEPPTDATGPLMGGQGEARLTLKQTVDSKLPGMVDRAFVRIWKNETGYNQVRDVAIPDPNDTTNVSMSVPADSGYSVGVIAYVADTANVNQSNASIPANIALAGGRTDSVTVAADTTTDVDLNVVPWKFDVSTNPDETNRELRQQRDELKQELDRSRERIQDLEDAVYNGERQTIKEFVKANPGAPYDEIIRHVMRTVPERVTAHLDDLEGEELLFDDDRYYPTNRGGKS